MGIFDKAKDAMSGQQDKVDAGVERAGDMVDDRTESKYAEQVDQGQEMAKDKLRDFTSDQPEQPEQPEQPA
jgi:MT0933-like antitoxin protein